MLVSVFINLESIHYRLSKYPFQILLNKSDVAQVNLLQLWHSDYEAFLLALSKHDSYLTTLNKSLVIHLSELFEQLPIAPISAKKKIGLEIL